SKSYGLDLGFDEFVEEEGEVQLIRRDKPRNPNARGGIERTFERARGWIEQHRDAPFFLFIHTYEAHSPHDRLTFTPGVPVGHFGEVFTIATSRALRDGKIPFDDGDARYLAALYDGGLRKADDEIASFLEFLGRMGLRDRTLVVVTSDHGE